MTPPPPPLWATLSELWHLEPGEATRCWRALYKARWTVSAALRQRVAYFEQQPATQRLRGVDDFVRNHLTPVAIVEALEALAGEALLSLQDKISIEDKVLGQVGNAGQWRYPQYERSLYD